MESKAHSDHPRLDAERRDVPQAGRTDAVSTLNANPQDSQQRLLAELEAGRSSDCQETTRWVREWYSHEHARWYPLMGRRVPKTLPLRWVEVVERRTVVKEEGVRSTAGR